MSIEIILLQIDWKDNSSSGGPVTSIRYTSAPFHVWHGGFQWYAAGNLLTIGSHESNYELVTDGLALSISGIDPSLQPIIDQYGFRNAPVDVLLATLPDNSDTVISAKFYHRGFAGSPVTEIDEDAGTITIGFETTSVFKNLDKNSQLMTTSIAHHQAHHPDDMFFQYTADSGIGEETWRDG